MNDMEKFDKNISEMIESLEDVLPDEKSRQRSKNSDEDEGLLYLWKGQQIQFKKKNKKIP